MNIPNYHQQSQVIEQWVLDNLTPELAEIADQLVEIDYDYYTIDHIDNLSFQINYASYAYIVQGRLLAEIAYKRLYKHKYSSFHAYCCNDLHTTESRARQLMEASRVAIELIASGHTKLPQNSSQAFALSKLFGDELVQAWESLLEVYELYELTTTKIKNFIFPPSASQVDSYITHIPVSPQSLYELTQLAFKLKMSINDVVVLMIQNHKYYLSLSLMLLKLNFST